MPETLGFRGQPVPRQRHCTNHAPRTDGLVRRAATRLVAGNGSPRTPLRFNNNTPIWFKVVTFPKITISPLGDFGDYVEG